MTRAFASLGHTIAKAALGLAGIASAMLLASCSTSGTGPSLSANPFDKEGSAPQQARAATAQPAVPGGDISARIALLLPLTSEGQTAAIAQGMKQAGELALFDFQDQRVQLIVKDTAGTPEGARAAAQAAISAGAEIIIGPLFARSVTAVAEVARPANIPVVAFSNNAEVAGNGVYLLSFQARQEIGRVVAYSAAQGRARFAALIPNDTYGKIVETEFRNAVSASGGTIVALASYEPGANGMLEESQKLFERVSGAIAGSDQPPGAPLADAVFIPGDEATLPTLGPIMRYAKLDPQSVKVIGNGGWDFRGLERVKEFVGGWYAAPDPNLFSAFTTKFSRAYGSAPPRIASFAYDGVSIAAILAGRYPKGQRYTAATLTISTGFNGIDGPVRFLPNGLSERNLAVLEVQSYGPQVLQPAPSAFSSATLVSGQSIVGAASTGIFQQ